MEAKELREIQARIKFDAPSMALCLGLDYEQYRRYLYGAAVIPENVKRAALELEQVQKQFDIQRDREYCHFLDTHYPNGIMSEAIECE